MTVPVVSIGFGLATREYSGKQTSERNRYEAEKTKGESGRIVQFAGQQNSLAR